MDDAQKILLTEKLKEAAASGRNVHVMAQEGKWIVYKDGAKRATARYATREGAINNAKKIMEPGVIETLIVHRKDGSVFKVLPLQDQDKAV